jgi:hypothetical protein
MGKMVRLLACVGTAMVLASGAALLTIVGSTRSNAVEAEKPDFIQVGTDDLTKKYDSVLSGMDSFICGGTLFQNASVTTLLCISGSSVPLQRSDPAIQSMVSGNASPVASNDPTVIKATSERILS